MRRYRDESPQARHTTAAIAAFLQYRTAGWVILQLLQERWLFGKKPNLADIRLNNKLFWMVENGMLNDLKTVGNAIRQELGDPSQTQLWHRPPEPDE